MGAKRTWTQKIRSLIEMDDHLLVPLTQGLFAKINFCDRAIIEPWNWCVGRSSTGFYARRGASTGDGRVAPLPMHRAILQPPPHLLVDHRSGDGLDNRRLNLRITNHAGNAHNRRIGAANTSGYKGVTFRRDRGTWLASIRCKGRYLKIGTFKTPEEAAEAYDFEARRLFGEFAVTNFAVVGDAA